MPASATALTLAIALFLSAAFTAVAPWLLRQLPAPPEAPEVRFAELASPHFGVGILVLTAVSATIVLALTPVELWPIWAPLAALGSLLGLIDARTGFLPLRLNYLALALVSLGVVASAWWRGEWQWLLWSAIAGLLATAVYAMVWRLSGGQLGFGDVRLAGLLAVATGATSSAVLLWCFLSGSVIGAVWAIAVRLRKGSAFPYGPSMLLGAPVGLAIAALLA